jgi:hypothetical protein
MQLLINRKFFTWLLLMAMLTIMLNGSHASAHAMDSTVTATSDQASVQTIDAVSHQCPPCPLDHHDDADDDECNSCAHCCCHAPLTVQPYRLDYKPFASDLRSFDPFKHLPEVYLSKFIPPQNLA